MTGPLVAILSGAGISTESGIPDYRGPNGLWRRDPEAEKLATYQYYMADPEIRRRSWQAQRGVHGMRRADAGAGCVFPARAAGLVAIAADGGARLVIVNAEPTPYDDLADEVIREPIGTALPQLLARLPARL
jgi:NAD-dependent SIR2 family protein deacetylase